MAGVAAIGAVGGVSFFEQAVNPRVSAASKEKVRAVAFNVNPLGKWLIVGIFAAINALCRAGVSR